MKRAGRVLLAVLGVLVLGVVVVLLGGLALIWAAGVSDRPAVILSVTTLVCVALLAGGGWLLTRLAAEPRRRRVRVIAAATAVLLLTPLVWWTVLRPQPVSDIPELAGVRYLTLPDGNRLAMLLVPAQGPKRGEPIVFLHGGPGVADMDHDAGLIGRLAATGRDVWLYDQLGAGRSSRLTDPSGYSLERDVADLEKVREHIGADRVVLIGHSYGSTLAATYLAVHPEHVTRVVFSVPGRLVPELNDLSGTGMVGRLPREQAISTLAMLAFPRSMIAYELSRHNPRAAPGYAGDAEMDSQFEELYRRSAAGLVCDTSRLPPAPVRPGFYANQVPLGRKEPYPDIRPQLRTLDTPALVLKPGCDYLPWSFAQDYRHTYANSQLVYLPDAGHQLYFEQPDRFVSLVSAFLDGKPLPMTPFTAEGPPADYRGTLG
ncbi:MAG TPA: alpha/beta fold hydrolase [Micromonospora sp.]